MRLRGVIVVMAMLLFTATLVAADTITLQNGDHVTGTFVSADGKTMALKTTYAAQISVKWPDVAQITTAAPVYVTTTSRRSLSGTISKANDAIVVHTSSGNVVVPLAEVAAVRSQQEQDAYEASLRPNWAHNWNGSFGLGFSLARGNSQATNLTTSFQLQRKTLHDTVTLHEGSVYSTATAANTVTANAILGGARYDRNLNPKLFGFVSADYTHDELQGLDLQSIYSAGLGWHAISNPSTTLDVMAGGNYTRQSYSGVAAPGVSLKRNLAAITTGEDFSHKFGKITSLAESFQFYPDLNDAGQYQFTFATAANTSVTGWLSWQVSLNDLYVSNPPIAGTKPNDVILSTGLTVTFHH